MPPIRGLRSRPGERAGKVHRVNNTSKFRLNVNDALIVNCSKEWNSGLLVLSGEIGSVLPRGIVQLLVYYFGFDDHKQAQFDPRGRNGIWVRSAKTGFDLDPVSRQQTSSRVR